MDVVLLAARLILAAVFAVAGLAKLFDRAGSRKAIVDFGLPQSLAVPLGTLLPLAELAVAVALLPVATAWWGALGAGALLLLFIAGIAFNLARGRQPDCHCFGQIHSAPAGWSTLVRNGLLAAVAGFIVWQGQVDPGPSAVSWLGAMPTAGLVGLVGGVIVLAVLAAFVWLLLNLIRQNGRLLARLEALEARVVEGSVAAPPAPAEVPAAPARGLPVGSPAPAFTLPGLYGEMLTLDFLRAAGQPLMLTFSDPGCGPCNTLAPEVARWQREHSANLTIALISRGTLESNRAKSAEQGLSRVLLQSDREVAEAYQVAGTPSAVLVRPDGTIGSPLAEGADAIRALVNQTVGTPAPASAPAAPTPAPAAAPAQALAPAPAAIPAAASDGSNADGAAAALPAPAGPQIGHAAPLIKLPDLTGKTVELAGFRGYKTLVLFWDPACGFCTQMLDDLRAWEKNHPPGAPKLLVVSTGTVEANRSMGLGAPVVLDQGFGMGGAYGAEGTPSAVLVDEQGKIASQLAVGADEVLALAGVKPDPARASNNGNGAGIAPAPTVGEPAPSVRLPDLNGKTVDLARFRGTKTLLLFWNPGCGFCSRMLDDLKAWEAKPPKKAPKLLVVSTGTVEANQAMGLRSAVLLDQNFATGNAFGASGTPSAVLVDERGKIASQLAVGAPAVLALAGGQSGQPAANGNGKGNGAPIPLALPRAKAGDPAPPVKLPDLAGNTVELARLRGTKTLLLFWNPGCGFCSRMVDDLKAWEASRPAEAPELLIVSTGTPEANQALGLQSTVVLDQGFSTGNAFGASGTPSAVLIDEQGKVASDVAVGAPAVLALARGEQAVVRPGTT